MKMLRKELKKVLKKKFNSSYPQQKYDLDLDCFWLRDEVYTDDTKRLDYYRDC